MQQLIDSLFSLSPEIRYVAVYHKGTLNTDVKPDIKDASDSGSDKYEELIVNPAILTLIKQRGNIDCGGANFVLIHYGNFYQYVAPIQDGHISVCIDPNADTLNLVEQIINMMDRNNM